MGGGGDPPGPMFNRGILQLTEPIRVSVRVAGVPIRPATLSSIGESIAQAACQRLASLPPPADPHAVQGYLAQLSMPRIVVEHTRQNIVFEFHDPSHDFGVSRNACAHWFELTLSLYADDYATLASRSARGAVRLELPNVPALLRKRACRDLVALDGQLYWACRTAPEIWADGVRRFTSDLSAAHKARVDQVRRGQVVDCAYCSNLLAWQRSAAAGEDPARLLAHLDADRLSDLVRFLPRADGGRHVLPRLICAAVLDPAVTPAALGRALPQWLLAFVRGSNVQPEDLGELDRWLERLGECPILAEILARFLRGGRADTSDKLVEWTAQALERPATRAAFRTAFSATLESGDALDPAAQERLRAVLAPKPSHGPPSRRSS